MLTAIPRQLAVMNASESHLFLEDVCILVQALHVSSLVISMVKWMQASTRFCGALHQSSALSASSSCWPIKSRNVSILLRILGSSSLRFRHVHICPKAFRFGRMSSL